MFGIFKSKETKFHELQKDFDRKVEEKGLKDLLSEMNVVKETRPMVDVPSFFTNEIHFNGFNKHTNSEIEYKNMIAMLHILIKEYYDGVKKLNVPGHPGKNLTSSYIAIDSIFTAVASYDRLDYDEEDNMRAPW